VKLLPVLRPTLDPSLDIRTGPLALMIVAYAIRKSSARGCVSHHQLPRGLDCRNRPFALPVRQAIQVMAL
jgi:hypothetical protein